MQGAQWPTCEIKYLFFHNYEHGFIADSLDCQFQSTSLASVTVLRADLIIWQSLHHQLGFLFLRCSLLNVERHRLVDWQQAAILHVVDGD